MRNILFVDDEAFILSCLKRGLRHRRDDWNMTFVESAQLALEHLQTHPVEILVSDIKMPIMDGIELMKIVKVNHPQIARIVLSGYSDQEAVLKTSTLVHQFLPKPFEIKGVEHAIDGALEQVAKLSNPCLEKLIGQIDALPSMPNLYFELISAVNKIDCSMSTIADIIGKDPGMSSRILQIANSAYFAPPSLIANPQHATVFLGLDVIKTLTLSIHVFSLFESSDLRGFSLEKLWRHSMTVAGMAKAVCNTEKKSKQSADQALIAGLFHDLGKLLLADSFGSRYQRVLDCIKDTNVSQVEAELQEFGITHADVGGYLIGLWGFPRELVDAVVYHHCPSRALTNEFNTLTAIHIANSFSHSSPEQLDSMELFDLDYINAIKQSDQLPVWLDACRNLQVSAEST